MLRKTLVPFSLDDGRGGTIDRSPLAAYLVRYYLEIHLAWW